MGDVFHVSIVGRRKDNEDRVDIHRMGISTFLGVYDGHGGTSTASMLKDHMYKIFSSYTKTMDLSRAFRLAYRDMDRLSLRLHHHKCGSTAVNAYIVYSGETAIIYTANVGDSRAIIVDDKVTLITPLHNEDNETEKSRVSSLGGIFDDGYVEGILNMTRAIGDNEIKKLVIGTPDIRRIERKGGYLILGSDGLFDTVTDGDILDICKTEAAQDIPSKLAQLAYDKGSQDNISIILMKL